MTNNERSDSPAQFDGWGPFGLLLGSGVALLAAVCCAVPALIAAGALGVIGGWLGSPWVIAAAAALFVAAVVWTVTRRRGTSDSMDCCNPSQSHGTGLPLASREDH